MAWISNKLDEVLRIGSADPSASRQRLAKDPPGKRDLFDESVSRQFLEQALKASLAAFAEVTQRHINALETRIATLEAPHGVGACRSLTETENRFTMSVGCSGFDPSAAATSLEAASKRTIARRMRRNRQRAKVTFAREQLLQLRPVTCVSPPGLLDTTLYESGVVKDGFSCLLQRVADLEVTVGLGVHTSSDLIFPYQCIAEGPFECGPLNPAVPASELAAQCNAARIIQRAWGRWHLCAPGFDHFCVNTPLYEDWPSQPSDSSDDGSATVSEIADRESSLVNDFSCDGSVHFSLTQLDDKQKWEAWKPAESEVGEKQNAEVGMAKKARAENEGGGFGILPVTRLLQLAAEGKLKRLELFDRARLIVSKEHGIAGHWPADRDRNDFRDAMRKHNVKTISYLDRVFEG